VTHGARGVAARQRLTRLAPACLGLVLGVVALGPGLGPGFVLRYDMVFVPDPPVVLTTGGFPRAMPSDVVVAVLAHVLPAQVVQKLILLGVFVLAASGAAALAPAERTGVRLASAAFYVWNAYLAQRLLLGQWALLLGFAGLPWAVRAAARDGPPWRLALALLPAAAGGFQAMLVSALTVLPVRMGAVRRVRGLVEGLVVVVTLSLPWAVPAVLSHAGTDPAGVDAFAARADGPYGTAGGLLALGGIWNAEADVPGQAVWLPATLRLALGVAAIVAFVWARRAGSADGSGYVRAWRPGLLAAGLLGLAIALLGAYLPGVLKGLIGFWAGFGPLRDGQAYIAPLVLLQAIGFGGIVDRLSRPVRRRTPTGSGSGVVPVVGVLAPLLVLPGLAWGAFGRLAAVDYPGEWRRVQAIVNADPRPGALISLPWGAHRAFAWNGGRVILDPATKMFARPVVWNDALTVGLADGRRLRVGGEDPLAGRVGGPIEIGTGPLTSLLRAEGIRYALIAAPDENTFRLRLPGAVPAFEGRGVLLLRLG
jgi:hypothetical protein